MSDLAKGVALRMVVEAIDRFELEEVHEFLDAVNEDRFEDGEKPIEITNDLEEAIHQELTAIARRLHQERLTLEECR